MSFLFRKNGSSSRRRIKDKLRGRNSDRGKREDEERVRYDGGGGGSESLPPPPSPWGFLFPEDFVRIDGNLKAVIVDEEGLDVIYWKKLLELENSGKIRKNPKPRRGPGEKSDGGFKRAGADGEEEEEDDDEGLYRGSGSNQKGDESMEEAFSFHVKLSQSPGGNNNTSVDDRGRFYTSSSASAASPSRPSSSSTGGGVTGIDYDSFVATTLALGTRLKETKRLLEQSKGKEDGCLTKLRSFFESAEEELRVITEEQLRIMDLVKKTTNYYQAGALKERNLFQLFVIIRDFLGMVDNACSEIARSQRKQRPAATVAGGSSSTAATPTADAAPQRNAVRFPILPPNFMSEHSRYSSSDSDSDS